MTETETQFLSTGRKHFILILLLPILLVFLVIQSMTVFGLNETTTGASAAVPASQDSPIGPTGVITDEYKVYMPLVFKPVPAAGSMAGNTVQIAVCCASTLKPAGDRIVFAQVATIRIVIRILQGNEIKIHARHYGMILRGSALTGPH